MRLLRLILALTITSLASGAIAQAVPPSASVGAPLSSATFRTKVMSSDVFEIGSSRLALQRSRSPAVQQFAQQMINDHTRTSTALNGGVPVIPSIAAGATAGGATAGPVGAVVGAGAGATAGAAADVTGALGLNPMLDPQHASKLNQLAALSGRAFDRNYRDMQVQAHQEAVALFASYAANGEEPSMRAFAQQTLPHLRQHLAMAKRLR
jgi:predicted outer membrane protein